MNVLTNCIHTNCMECYDLNVFATFNFVKGVDGFAQTPDTARKLQRNLPRCCCRLASSESWLRKVSR